MSGNGIGGEGVSSTRPPLLTGVNYALWKGKMEAYVCQIHDRPWMAIEDGVHATYDDSYGRWRGSPQAEGTMDPPKSLRLRNGTTKPCMQFYVPWMTTNTNSSKLQG